MFGKNKILKVQQTQQNPLGILDVHSIFYTIQGEGPFAGRASVFVRLRGCSLACSWCDTEFEKKTLPDLSPNELLHAVMRNISTSRPAPFSTHRPLIVITGGEPMRQHLRPFIMLANKECFAVQIETAGIHWDPRLAEYVEPGRLSIVCSPKTPTVLQSIQDHAVVFKYIVDSSEPVDAIDGLPAYAVSQRGQPNTGKLCRPYWLFSRPEQIYVQPLDPIAPGTPGVYDHNLAANRKRCVDLVQQYGYTLSLQQHKILGLE